MLKDLYGIWYVVTQLGDFSDQALTEFSFLAQQHSKWLQTFQKQLSHWIDHASPSEWAKLEVQDPSGKLKKLGFERSIKMLMGGNIEKNYVTAQFTGATGSMKQRYVDTSVGATWI